MRGDVNVDYSNYSFAEFGIQESDSPETKGELFLLFAGLNGDQVLFINRRGKNIEKVRGAMSE